MSQQVVLQMPQYKHRDRISALKIANITDHSETAARLHFVEPGYSTVCVDMTHQHLYIPEVGGYYVVYNDGSHGYMPACIFERIYVKE